MVQVTWPRWPPCPYMVKTFKKILLQSQKSYEVETWRVSLGAQALQSLFKWWPWVDLDLFYGKIKLGHLDVWMGKTVTKSFNGGKLTAKDYIYWIILLMKKNDPKGLSAPVLGLNTCTYPLISNCSANQCQRGTCVKPVFWPLQKPNYESYRTTFSSRCFISWMIKVFWLSIDLNLMVAMVTKMAARIG